MWISLLEKPNIAFALNAFYAQSVSSGNRGADLKQTG